MVRVIVKVRLGTPLMHLDWSTAGWRTVECNCPSSNTQEQGHMEPKIRALVKHRRQLGVDTLVPERVLVLFRAGTMLLRSGLGTFLFWNQSIRSIFVRYLAYSITILQTIDW